MRIANPIYDVVFDYLLDDENVARLVLSALIGKEVLELQPRPTEVHPKGTRPDAVKSLVLRKIFAATIRLEDDHRRQVLIEVQKARSTRDVQRYRRCLGTLCASPENLSLDPSVKGQPPPIVTIYFLGEGLEGVDVPVLRINHHYLDVATGRQIQVTDSFVGALGQDAVVVQINRLKNRQRTELERLLEVFDQNRKLWMDPHLLEIMEEDVPEPYREVLWRLLRAGAETKVLVEMDLEDDILAAFREQARETSDLRQAVAEKRQALAEADSLIAALEKRMEQPPPES